MHYLIGIITAVMVLSPASDSGGKSLYQLWMDAYEKYLYQQMYDNIENARRNEEICQNSAKNEVLHEQAAGKKVAEEPPCTDGRGDMVQNTVEETHDEEVEVPVQDGQDTTVAAEVESHERNGQTPLYSVNGAVLREDLQEYLYRRLTEAGIGYFFPYTLMLAYQESRFDVLAQNPNGRDKGLFQYRIEYYPGLDWTNPYAEADVFIQQMANRAYAGRTISEMISRHNTSDYGTYSPEYVAQVMQWAERTVQIR